MAIRRSGEQGLTRRERWPLYLGGMLAETAFILGLTLAAFLMALVAKAVF
jgi:hypothetical protein